MLSKYFTLGWETVGLALHEVSKHIPEFPCGSHQGLSPPGLSQWEWDPSELFPVGVWLMSRWHWLESRGAGWFRWRVVFYWVLQHIFIVGVGTGNSSCSVGHQISGIPEVEFPSVVKSGSSQKGYLGLLACCDWNPNLSNDMEHRKRQKQLLS